MVGNLIAIAGAECVRLALLALRRHFKRKLSRLTEAMLRKIGSVLWRALRGR